MSFILAAENSDFVNDNANLTFWDRLERTAEPGAAGYDVNGTNTQSLSKAVGDIIAIVLSFVGVIFFGLVIYAGILWMTARGNEEQVTKAKKIMMDASIGLAVTLAAYIITITVVRIVS